MGSKVYTIYGDTNRIEMVQAPIGQIGCTYKVMNQEARLLKLLHHYLSTQSQL